MTPDSQPMQLRVIIVDDEIDAGKNLQKILLEYVDPGIHILGVVNGTKDAEKMILQQTPDIVFLDIEMPHENAFDFLERINPVHFEVIFVTAYDEYAVRAFKLNAVDYILKPISIEEVRQAVKKALERIAFRNMMGEKTETGNFHPDLISRSRLDKIRLRDNTGFEIVDFKDILYVEARGSYSSVCFLKDSNTPKNIITGTSLNEYEELFPNDFFCRAHRSYLVNCMHVKKVLADDNSFVIMKNGDKLPVSRRRIPELMEFFKNQ
jgi:two-component system, LytTR family, response regulator